MSRQVSDHCALMVKNTIKDWGPKPFRTFDVWKHSQGFKEVIWKSWADPISSGNRMVVLKVKLKGLKKELNLWKKEVFSTYTRNKKELVAEIERIDRYDDKGNLQEDLRVRRVELLSQLRNMEKELAMVRQKAKVDWLKGADTNSKFYHSRLRWRRAKSEIEGLWINEVWCEDPTKVKSYMKGYFESRFGVNERFRLNLDKVCFKTITNDDNDMLCSNISESEILDVVSQCCWKLFWLKYKRGGELDFKTF